MAAMAVVKARNGLACRVLLGSWPLAESWCGREMKIGSVMEDKAV